MLAGRRIHFIGVGGSGMSGLAELLVRRGCEVSGSDARMTTVTGRLARLGVQVHEGHRADRVDAADLVVHSSAIGADNPEMVEARRRGIPIVARGELLADLMRGSYGIAIAGAHGKTTTTSMIAWVLHRAGLDPTAVIGGRLRAFDSGIRIGAGPHFVAEADESDRSFLRLAPRVAVLTNLDVEHLESYGTFDDLERAFRDFAGRVPPDGAVVVCADDPRLRAMAPAIERQVVTYALDGPADLSGTDAEAEGFASRCEVWSGSTRLGTLALGVAGRHNLQNALAAVAVGRLLDVPFDRIAAALAEFKGAERRFEKRGEAGGVVVIDDYGHHPTEIAAVLRTARGLKGGRVLAAFQPHRFTRTRLLLDEFGPALSAADAVWLTGIYGAGEPPIPGVTIEALAEAVGRSVAGPVHVVLELEALAEAVAREARPGDVVVVLGAGSIGAVADLVLDRLRRKFGTGE